MERRRTGIYARISQDRAGAGLGVERQRTDCLRLAKTLGWTVVEQYIDNDVSAYSGKPRPDYRRMLADIEAGRIDGVVVWHNDRLHRSPRELEEYVDLCERRKIVTQTVQAGELDLSTPSGRAVARTLGAWARFEVEHKSERTKRAQLQAVQEGRWIGGARPLGWQVKPDGSAVLERAEARRIARATRDVLAGVSLGSVVAAWNADGFTTRTGRSWNYTTVRQVLMRARNAALIEYDGRVVGPATWPAIVSEDEWRAVCALLADPSRRRSASNRIRWLLAGIAVCGLEDCGAPLRSGTATSGNGTLRTVYRCGAPGAGHVARVAAKVDNVVDRTMRARLSQADLADLVPMAAGDTVNREELRAERVALRARLDEATEAFADDETVSVAQLRSITKRLRDRIAELDALLAPDRRGYLLSGISDAPDPAAAWAAAPLDRQRAILRALVTVTVMPTPRGASFQRFDPALVQIKPVAS